MKGGIREIRRQRSGPDLTMKMTILAIAILTLAVRANQPPIKVWFRDDDGRHFIPRGGVVVTEQSGVPTTDYSLDDYRRMLRLGANFQVIRLTLGPLGSWPGNELQQEYLEKVDRDLGASTIFVGADRHYPDGFSVLLDNSLVVVSDPLRDGELRVLKSPEGWAKAFSWDPRTQRLNVSRWPGTGKTATLKIIPGIIGPPQKPNVVVFFGHCN